MRPLAALMPLPTRLASFSARSPWALIMGVLGLLGAGLLAAHAWTAWLPADLLLGHDEAEHLHVVFALERGERPYRDFIENHPVLPHLLLGAMRHPLGAEDTLAVYRLGRGWALLHAIGVLALMLGWLHRHRASLGLCLHPAVTLPLGLLLPGVWNVAIETPARFDFFWQMRADWPCHFWTLAAALCIARAVRRHDRPVAWRLALGGGLCAGFATALLAKSVMLLLPAAAALVITLLRMGSQWTPDAAVMRRMGLLALTFVAAAALTFGGCVAFELSATGVSLQDYVSANFTLNSSKHLSYNATDRSSINMLRQLSGLGLGGAIALTVAGFCLAARALREQRWLRHALFTFTGMVIAFTAVLPSYSNGQCWPQYLIPAYLALALLLVLILDEAARFCSHVTVPERWELSPPMARGVRWAPAGLLVLLLLGGLLVRFGDLQYRRLEAHLHAMAAERTFGDPGLRSVPDRLLPDDLSYLTFRPEHKPAKARAWGYFFMLGGDQGMWNDVHRLGLGPDPATHWQTLYRQTPPDAITVASRSELREMLRTLKRAQQVDLRWLDEAFAADYACVSRLGTAVHVRVALQARFEQAGFKPCPASAALPDWQ